MKKQYNGHEGWRAWNVALWIANDEGLYRQAKLYRNTKSTIVKAAEAMFEFLTSAGITETPDGAKYSKHNLKLAMRDL